MSLDFAHRRSPLRQQIFPLAGRGCPVDSLDRFDECTRPGGGFLWGFFLQPGSEGRQLVRLGSAFAASYRASAEGRGEGKLRRPSDAAESQLALRVAQQRMDSPVLTTMRKPLAEDCSPVSLAVSLAARWYESGNINDFKAKAFCATLVSRARL